ncbi:MAG: hypothetical protein RL701_1220, partial [Pseudomonadota bacterium]
LPLRFALDEAQSVGLALRNDSDKPLRGVLHDDAPDEFSVERERLEFALAPRSTMLLEYDARAPRRGEYDFGAINLRLDGALGLGALIVVQPAAASVRVYPNPRGPRRYELALRQNVLHSLGVRRSRALGRGGEFEQLRDYVPGDALRELDWKATAKRSRPITRIHGQEHSQTVLLALDIGRLMAQPIASASKLDHAIDAALLVAWVALRAGDRVGLVVFANEVEHFVPAGRGHGQYLRLVETLYRLEAGDAYVDFRELARFVRARVPRRSLLLVFSDLLDESQTAPLVSELPKLGQKHVVVCVTLNDPLAAELATAPPRNADEVYRRAAAADLLAERALIHKQLSRAGVAVLESSAANLAVASVNRYFAIKSQQQL